MKKLLVGTETWFILSSLFTVHWKEEVFIKLKFTKLYLDKVVITIIM